MFMDAMRNNEHRPKNHLYADGMVENIIHHFPGKRLNMKNFHVNKNLVDSKLWWINEKIGEPKTIDPNPSLLPVKKRELASWLLLSILLCKSVRPEIDDLQMFRQDEK
jgi:hypothetical protein